ncbi:MAG: hypothetical protein ABH881_00430 [bacterium]
MDFFAKYKKILFIAGFVLVAVIFGYFLFLLFFKSSLPSSEEKEIVSTTTESGGLPTAGQGTFETTEEKTGGVLPDIEETTTRQADIVAKGGITSAPVMEEQEVMGLAQNTDSGYVNYYNKDDGKFYRIGADGRQIALSDQIFYEASNVVWSPKQNKAVIEYPDGSKIVYDFDKKVQTTLPKHWEDFNFSPSGEKIVAKSLGLDPENRWLITSNDDGSMIKPIEALGNYASTVYPSWSPNNQVVAMYTKSLDIDRQEVFFLGQNNENFKSMVIEGRGFEPSWSSNGEKLLYSVYSSQDNLKPNLWIAGAQGQNIGAGRKKLNVETWADKCVFTGNVEIYCAVPDNLPEGAGLFPEMSKTTKDKLYKINTETGTKKLVAVPEESLSMSDLTITADNKYLFFTDNQTGQLRRIQLEN